MSGAREIERKFLVGDLPEDLEQVPSKKIRQGYLLLGDSGTEVRVRKEGKRHALTLKEGRGLDRAENEIRLDAAQFATLWPLTRGRRVKKTRYELPHDGRTIQLDVYRGKLAGLITAEVEFPDEGASSRFTPPDWIGHEVTGDEHYSNQNLARDGLPQGVGR
jgi:adenylate cyclase